MPDPFTKEEAKQKIRDHAASVNGTEPGDGYTARSAAHRALHAAFDSRCVSCREFSEEARQLYNLAHAPRRPSTARLSSVDIDEADELPAVGVFDPELLLALLYRGQLNGIHGRGGTLKTWIAYYIALQEVRKNCSALLFDYEVGIKRAAKRLHRLGATADERDMIIWTRPGPMFPDEDKQQIVDQVDRLGVEPSLAIFDSVSRAMSGLSGRLGEDVNSWVDAVPAWVLETWPNVADLLIDHLSRNDPESLMPTGAVQKYNNVQGAQYLIKKGKKASKTDDGYSTITCAKDQEGNYTEDDVIAQFHMGPSYPHGLLQPPSKEVKAEAEAEKRSQAEQAILEVLEDGSQLSLADLKKACGGRAQLHTEARDVMVEEGQLKMEKRGREKFYWLAEPGSVMTIDLENTPKTYRRKKSKTK